MNCAGCQHNVGGVAARDAFICVEKAGDEYIYSYWRCDSCGFYTCETYHDRFMGSESVTIDPPIDSAEGTQILTLIRQCPKPNDKRCGCPVHRKMSGEQMEMPEIATVVEEPAKLTRGPGLKTIECPVCGKPTESLKQFGVMSDVAFLGIAARSSRCTYTACPTCMRGMVLKDTFTPTNILMANLMWILVVLPYSLAVCAASMIPGHSKAVKNVLRSGRLE